MEMEIMWLIGLIVDGDDVDDDDVNSFSLQLSAVSWVE